MDQKFRYTTANRRQRNDHGEITLSAVNALALATGKPWDEVFHQLEDQAVFYGQMLHENICAVGLLAAMGYARVKKPRGCQTLQDISQYLAGTWPHVTSAILVTHIQGAPVSSRRFQLLLPEKNPDGGKRFVLHDTMDRGRFSCVSTLYLPAAEAGLQVSPPKCPSSIDVPRSLPQNHFGYRFFQPNPRNNFIGDCVIRAYAAVLDVDWGTALRRLAQSCDLNLTWLNLVDVDQYLLSELKCTHHEALRTDGHLLKGVDFCAYMNAHCHHGERIFVHAGPHHVAAVIPDPDETRHPRYVIADCWDSSCEFFRDYWVYTPPEPAKPAPYPGQPLTEVQEGSCILHPTYGKGEIVALNKASGSCRIRFLDGSERSLSAAWVLEKCTAA
ncbi:MAG: hypothetical protein IJL88_01285 [Clostridia bacterium]|nr:hypothetical protein [Clostridia bacterium]